MKCKECGGEMKPLFTGFFCPNNCDDPKVLAARYEKAAKEIAEKKLSDDEIAKFWRDHWGMGHATGLNFRAVTNAWGDVMYYVISGRANNEQT